MKEKLYVSYCVELERFGDGDYQFGIFETLEEAKNFLARKTAYIYWDVAVITQETHVYGRPYDEMLLLQVLYLEGEGLWGWKG